MEKSPQREKRSKKYIFLAVALTITIICASLLFGCQNEAGTHETLAEVPAFMYHSIKPADQITTPSSMVVSKENFEKDLQYLAENGYTAISLKELEEYYNSQTSAVNSGGNSDAHQLPDKPIVITFDDGYEDNYLYAYPLLKEYRTKAVIFTIVWSVGRDKFILNDDPINPHFTWEEGREMAESGLVEIGSHTFDMHNQEGFSYGYGEACGYGLGKMTGENKANHTERIMKDLLKSKELIEENIGREAIGFAYPYGFHNDEIIKMVENAGFKLAFITEAEAFRSSPYKIRRFAVKDDVRVSEILENF